MSNNNHKNSSCAFAEQIVSYLYDEFERDEKIKFEAHLADCSFCADEYAGFGFVRSSVLEWRNEDFSKLATPTFDIPAVKNQKSLPGVSTESRSWLGDFRKMFSFNPALAMAGLAVLVVCAGITLFALNFSGNNEVAEKGIEKNAVKTPVSPTVEILKKLDEKNGGDKEVEKSAPPASETVNFSPQKERERQIVPVKSVVKVSGNAPKNSSNNPAVNLKETSDRKTPPVRKRQVPNLNDLDDDDDETIRLADLFDELDTK